MWRGEEMGVKLKNLAFDYVKQQVRITLKSTCTLRTAEGKGTKTPAGRRTLLLDEEGYHLLKYSVEKAVTIAKDHGSVLHQNDFIFRNPVSNRPWALTRMNDLTIIWYSYEITNSKKPVMPIESRVFNVV
ncbi:hypothetical protein [Listeria immobilis]|uniref:hypothetical protein n=2 Tax=Listeria immobilis TaxID=2713502 RepID=UPI0021AB315F|nr:hypothetical protein [Listeria immobilis]